MSLRAVGFVEDWLSENVQPGSCVGHGRAETPSDYAVQLLIAANGHGISLQEIASEFPDLVGVITGILAGSPLTLGEHWPKVKEPLVPYRAPTVSR
jgi:hypothetical protein